MNILNEPIKHILYGDGKVISQQEGILSVQFSELHGIKKFLYPDAFENYLKLFNQDIEVRVLEELHDKKTRIEAEELRKQQEYEETAKKLSEKPKLVASRKKASTKSKVSKQTKNSHMTVLEEIVENEE